MFGKYLKRKNLDFHISPKILPFIKNENKTPVKENNWSVVDKVQESLASALGCVYTSK